MTMFEFIVLASGSLFFIIDPLGCVPAFLAITPTDTPEQRIRMARLACAVATGVLLVFAVLGEWIFKFLGITQPAFQLAGSMVLLIVAVDMLRAKRSAVQETVAETNAAVHKADIAVAPLAVPMLSGPGAITTVILLHKKAANFGQQVALYLCIAAVMLACYVILRLSATGAKWLGPIALKIITRLMGLMLAAVAFQFMINALKELKGTLF